MKKTIKIYLLFEIILLSCGCKKFLTLPIPTNLTLTDDVFSSDQTATAAVLNMYAYMQEVNNLPYMQSMLSGIAADELTNVSTSMDLQEIYKNSVTPTNGTCKTMWSTAYTIIYQANNILEALSSSSLKENIKSQLAGEALFVRAYWHFYLTNNFGDIPIITDTDYLKNNRKKRDSTIAVYKQIEDDLLLAKSLLGENYMSNNSITSGTERVRPNKYAAIALLSRLYLYSEQYDSAIRSATEIIDRKDIYDTTQLEKVFLTNSKECIFQLMPTSPNTLSINTQEGRYFILNTKPLVTANVFNCTFLTESLLASFEPSDQRKSKWVGKYTDPASNTVYYYPAKYKIRTSTSITEYSAVLRLAEIYLIRAEAETRIGKVSSAIDDINIIRRRSGLKNIEAVLTNISEASLVTAILHERRVELFTELGHRWYDLKRSKTINQVMEKEAIVKNTTWKGDWSVWPIPQIDRDKNSLLTQNLGYN